MSCRRVLTESPACEFSPLSHLGVLHRLIRGRHRLSAPALPSPGHGQPAPAVPSPGRHGQPAASPPAAPVPSPGHGGQPAASPPAAGHGDAQPAAGRKHPRLQRGACGRLRHRAPPGCDCHLDPSGSSHAARPSSMLAPLSDCPIFNMDPSILFHPCLCALSGSLVWKPRLVRALRRSWVCRHEQLHAVGAVYRVR